MLTWSSHTGINSLPSVLQKIIGKRVGELTQEDIQILQSRVKPQSHQDIKEGTVIACKDKVVNKYNRLCLDQIDKELFRIEAINSHSNIPNYKPKIDEKRGTDCLCNGSIGTLNGIIVDRNKQVHYLMIKFDDEGSGREMRRCHPRLVKQYPGCTPIKNKHKICAQLRKLNKVKILK